MAYFLCYFQSFPLLWAIPAKMPKKMQFPCFSAQQESIIFMILLCPSPSSFIHYHDFLWNLNMTLHIIRWHMAYFLFNFQDFPLLWTASAISIVSMGFSAIFLGFPLLWAASAKNAEKVLIFRFPSDFEYITNKSRWHMAYFPCKCYFFLCFGASAKLLKKSQFPSFLSLGFFVIFLFLLCFGALHLGQLLKKLQFPCFSHCRKVSIL